MSDYTRLRPAIAYYENICRGEYGAGFVGAATAQFGELQNKYYSKVDNPDYSSNLNKFCYLFKYAVANGYFVYNTLNRAKEAIRGSIFSPNGMRIACIGGGPGSEIIGILRYLRQVEPQYRTAPIEIVIFDRERTWEEVSRRVLQCTAEGANVSVSFAFMDATDPATYMSIDFSGFGIVISSFFMSETRKLKIATVSRQFWKFVLSSLRKDAWFVAVDYADNNGVASAYLSSVLASAGRPFRDVLSDPDVGMSCPDSKAAIMALETELDHRPRKNAANLVRVVAAG